MSETNNQSPSADNYIRERRRGFAQGQKDLLARAGAKDDQELLALIAASAATSPSSCVAAASYAVSAAREIFPRSMTLNCRRLPCWLKSCSMSLFFRVPVSFFVVFFGAIVAFLSLVPTRDAS
jgi:hypothetical protein